MAGSSFKANNAAFAAMAVGPELRAACLAIAEKAKADAIALAADFAQTGEYLNSFEVTSTTTELRTGFGSHPVAAGVLTNVSPHAAAVEWGNKRDPKAHHVLGRVLAGLSHG